MATRSLNKATLIGNLTRDPELKYTPNGTAVCTFGVATNRSWTTGDGQTKEETQYHRIVAWQKLGELCAKLLAKGKKVFVEGRIVYRSFTGSDGQQRSITEIVADDFIVFDSRPKGVGSSVANDNGGSYPGQQNDDYQPPQDEYESTSNDEESSKKKEDISPDDIPF